MRIRGRARDGWKTKGKCWKPHFRYFQSPFLQCLLVKHLSTHLDLGVSLRLGPLDVSPTSKSVPGSGRVFSAWPPKTSKHGWMSVCAKIFKYYCFFNIDMNPVEPQTSMDIGSVSQTVKFGASFWDAVCRIGSGTIFRIPPDWGTSCSFPVMRSSKPKWSAMSSQTPWSVRRLYPGTICKP